MILQPACGLDDEDISDGPRTGFAFFSKFRQDWTGGQGHESVCRPSDSQLMGDAWDDGCWHVVIRLKGLALGRGAALCTKSSRLLTQRQVSPRFGGRFEETCVTIVSGCVGRPLLCKADGADWGRAGADYG